MASSKEFVEFVADQLRDAGHITYRKMFGEYGLYCDGKIFALICDDRLFFKMTHAALKVHPGLPETPPYEGARNYYLIEDVDDRELLTKLAIATCEELPMPVPKARKKP